MTKSARQLILLAWICLPSVAPAQSGPAPNAILESYQRGEDLERRARAAVNRLTLTPNWIESGAAFWYRNALGAGAEEFWLVDSATGRKSAPFDAAKLAQSLSAKTGKSFTADWLPFDEFAFEGGRQKIRFSAEGKRWECSLADYALTELGNAPSGRPETGGRGPGGPGGGQGGGSGRGNRSPDEKYVFSINEGKLTVRAFGADEPLYTCPIEGVASARWSPDSKKLVVFKVIPGDRKQVHLIRSSPTNGTRGELISRLYDQPGDKLDTFEGFVVDPFAKTETKTDLPPIWTGGHPWANPPGIDWLHGGKEFAVDYAERGYGRYFVDAVSLETAKRRAIVDEDPDTFFDTTSSILRHLEKTSELIWRSQRDGFGRLYLVDVSSGSVKNVISPPNAIVRSVEWIDEDNRKLCFSANNVDEGRDPYFIHYFTVGFDGKGLVRLTDGNGTHRIVFSPDRKTYVDSYSRVDEAPIHEFRRTSDGRKLLELERSDLAEWTKVGIPRTEVFVAKARDGKTDIWGVVVRPSNFDPNRKYPIVENIYAGPHDSFVPKSFSPVFNMQRIAELGFIVVQIDGMGTDNRGKAFHDVSYKNIADAGFPDRILWMKALAAKYPYMDIERVGVYGTSAGGQNAAAAVLFHPEFYKVAVASCGCHDNRMDKTWWNEQWMGVVGEHYAAQSNITNAAKLKGKLMLLVGELDRNVPPESTFRFADALIRANREFELVYLPGLDHTGGGPYGDRKRMDFFVRHLLGVASPDWNALPVPEPNPVRGNPPDAP